MSNSPNEKTFNITTVSVEQTYYPHQFSPFKVKLEGSIGSECSMEDVADLLKKSFDTIFTRGLSSVNEKTDTTVTFKQEPKAVAKTVAKPAAKPAPIQKVASPAPAPVKPASTFDKLNKAQLSAAVVREFQKRTSRFRSAEEKSRELMAWAGFSTMGQLLALDREKQIALLEATE